MTKTFTEQRQAFQRWLAGRTEDELAKLSDDLVGMQDYKARQVKAWEGIEKDGYEQNNAKW